MWTREEGKFLAEEKITTSWLKALLALPSAIACFISDSSRGWTLPNLFSEGGPGERIIIHFWISLDHSGWCLFLKTPLMWHIDGLVNDICYYTEEAKHLKGSVPLISPRVLHDQRTCSHSWFLPEPWEQCRQFFSPWLCLLLGLLSFIAGLGADLVAAA